MKNCLYCLLLAMLMSGEAFAVPAYPRPIAIKQPDGSVITIVLKGDEHLKWAQTIDGYTVLRNNNGVYEYAVKDSNGDLVLSGKVARDVASRSDSEVGFLAKTPKKLYYSKPQLSLSKSIQKIQVAELKRAFPKKGERKLLCLLIGFKDCLFSKTQADFETLFNQAGYSIDGASGSVKDFYKENSYDQFILSTTVAGPYVAANNMSYYGSNDAEGNDVKPEEMVKEAINAADATVNFADFDNDNDGYVDGVYIIFAGYGEDSGASKDAIWAHAFRISPVVKDGVYVSRYSCSAELGGNSGSSITPIGVICHEFGHTLGAPDYYDTDSEDGGKFDGTGDWDLMASGSWNNEGRTPAHHNAYTKVKVYGWASATLLNNLNGLVTVAPAEGKDKIFCQINSTTPGEYWILENRQQQGFDVRLPGHGLMVYHVHSEIGSAGNKINATYPQKMYPVCANAPGNPDSDVASYGDINRGSCPFPGTGMKTSFTDATTPSMTSWTGSNIGRPITNIVETSARTITFTISTSLTANTIAATAIAATGSTLNGQVNANNATTTVIFEYGTTANYGSTKSATPATVTGATATNVACALTGLVANTTYYYRVKAESSEGTSCGAQMTFKTLSNATGVEAVSDEELAIFPNPATTIVTVRFNNTERYDVVKIYNIQGMLVKQISIEGRDTDVDVSSLASGTYIIMVGDGGSAIRKRFVKL